MKDKPVFVCPKCKSSISSTQTWSETERQVSFACGSTFVNTGGRKSFDFRCKDPTNLKEPYRGPLKYWWQED